jgi:transposase
MRYVGLDLHSKQATWAILEPRGDTEPVVRTRTVKGSPKKILAEIAKINGPFAICYEASTSYGAFYDALSQMAERVVVAHPGQLRLVYRSKTKHDRADAKVLAKLLYAGFIPTVHVPKPDVRGWRRLIGRRRRLVHERIRIKNQLRALLRGLLIEAPKNLWSKAGTRWLMQVHFDYSADALHRDDLVAQLDFLTGAIGRAENELDRMGQRHPHVQLLQTIPGIGPRTAEAVVAWVDDAQRFRHVRAIGNYFGLVPREDSSASTRRLGHITQEGPSVIRWLLNQSTWQVVRLNPSVKARYDRICRDDPHRRKIALVAVMHYLARAMFAMLRTGETWQPDRVAGARRTVVA